MKERKRSIFNEIRRHVCGKEEVVLRDSRTRHCMQALKVSVLAVKSECTTELKGGSEI